ncbi:MAG TPA: hypothetical protein VGB42_11990 [Candidatus Thermoplasmatota archaeon]
MKGPAAGGSGGGADGSGHAERVRVGPGDVKEVGKARVANRTATSIEVTVAEDGTVTVTDCCLEEQGQ